MSQPKKKYLELEAALKFVGSDPVLRTLVEQGMTPVQAFLEKKKIDIYQKTCVKKARTTNRQYRSSCISGDDYINQAVERVLEAKVRKHAAAERKKNSKAKKLATAAVRAKNAAEREQRALNNKKKNVNKKKLELKRTQEKLKKLQ